jgi:N-acetylglucosaminyldiphosphoundecaprenol N-acetyl-beta-D-mannosaminyltransferase
MSPSQQLCLPNSRIETKTRQKQSVEKNDRLNILDIWVDPVDGEQAQNRVLQFLEGDRPHSIFAANPEKNFSVPQDSTLYSVFQNADLLIPDGVGMVWAAKLLYGKAIGRVPGVDFMHTICRLAAKGGKSIFLYGAKEAVNQKAAQILLQTYMGLRIAGRSNGYVSESEMPQLIQRINDSGAQILFLALGSPKQEQWFATYADQLDHVRVCQGIGGTLDTIAGTVKRAPQLWQMLSAEWLYRLLSEPKRIKRQRVLPVFAFHVVRQAVVRRMKKV